MQDGLGSGLAPHYEDGQEYLRASWLHVRIKAVGLCRKTARSLKPVLLKDAHAPAAAGVGWVRIAEGGDLQAQAVRRVDRAEVTCQVGQVRACGEKRVGVSGKDWQRICLLKEAIGCQQR